MNNGQQEFNPFFSAMPQQGAQQNAQQGSWFGPWGMGGANMPGAMGMNRYQREPQKANSDFWVPVNSLEEAKAVFVQPGQKKWIMILNAMMFAVKSVNDAGVPDFKAFDFYPHTDVQVPQENTNDMINNLSAQLSAVLQKLGDMEKEVASMKEAKNNGGKSFRGNANGTKPAAGNVNGAGSGAAV